MIDKFNTDQYEDLFRLESSAFEDNVQDKIEKLRDKSVIKYRTKTIRSGNVLEVEVYPIWQTPLTGKRVVKNTSRKAQTNLNNKNAQKRLTRLLNANFDERHIWLTLTYPNGAMPADPERAKKDMENYIRRVKRHVKKCGLPELKYVYVTEFGEARVHHHIIMNLEDRDAAESMWKNGGRIQSRRLQPDDFGLAGMARYITKQKRKAHAKKYVASKNLDSPIITVSETKITRRKAEKLAREENLAQEAFEKLYKGYCFKEMETKYSAYTSGVYLYARMTSIKPVNCKRKNKRKTKRRE